MTAIVSIECGDLDKEVVVGEEVLRAYGSAIYIEVGEKISLRDLLYGLLLRSGNDAAMVIAKNVAGSMEAFVALMNEYASKIGMKNTIFYNNHGLEESNGKGNLSSAKDMALLTKYAMQNETFREIFGTKKYVAKTNYKTYSWTSKNKLIHTEDYITGGKTGFTEKARRTLVTTAKRNNINVVVVTLNDSNDFNDHKEIYKNIFKNYESVLVLKKGNIKIKGENVYKDNILYLNEDIYVTVKSEEKSDLRINYELYKNKKYSDGDVVGSVKVYIGDKEVVKKDILIKMEKKESWWDVIKGWFKW